MATAKVLQPEWLGGLALYDATLDGRVPFEDCLAFVDVLCAGVSKNVVDLLEQTRALATGRRPVFVDVDLRLYERGPKRRAWPVLAETAFRVEEVPGAPRYWQCRRGKRGSGAPTITAPPEPLAATVGELAGMAFTGWTSGFWGLTVRQADRLHADRNRRFPECLLRCAAN